VEGEHSFFQRVAPSLLAHMPVCGSHAPGCGSQVLVISPILGVLPGSGYISARRISDQDTKPLSQGAITRSQQLGGPILHRSLAIFARPRSLQPPSELRTLSQLEPSAPLRPVALQQAKLLSLLNPFPGSQLRMEMASSAILANTAQQPLPSQRDVFSTREAEFTLREDPSEASGAGVPRSESAQDEAAALAALELKLKYISTQRALCAIKCQTFMEELAHQQQLHARLQSGPRPVSPGSRSARRSARSVPASEPQRGGSADDGSITGGGGAASVGCLWTVCRHLPLHALVAMPHSMMMTAV